VETIQSAPKRSAWSDRFPTSPYCFSPARTHALALPHTGTDHGASCRPYRSCCDTQGYRRIAADAEKSRRREFSDWFTGIRKAAARVCYATILDRSAVPEPWGRPRLPSSHGTRLAQQDTIHGLKDDGTSQALPKFESYGTCGKDSRFWAKLKTPYDPFHGIGRLDCRGGATPLNPRSRQARLCVRSTGHQHEYL
jgi:hypothetical protein